MFATGLKPSIATSDIIFAWWRGLEELAWLCWLAEAFDEAAILAGLTWQRAVHVLPDAWSTAGWAVGYKRFQTCSTKDSGNTHCDLDVCHSLTQATKWQVVGQISPQKLLEQLALGPYGCRHSVDG